VGYDNCGWCGFCILVILLVAILVKRQKATDDILTQPITKAVLDEGKTIVMKRPPEGTMKLLPGKLIVLKGEDVSKEIRFQVPKDASTKEFTFGRQEISDQNPYGHIRLKEQTVSSIQAKLLYTGKGYLLTNNSTVNPTMVNNKALNANETVELKDGDKIKMGEVEFKYEAR